MCARDVDSRPAMLRSKRQLLAPKEEQHSLLQAQDTLGRLVVVCSHLLRLFSTRVDAFSNNPTFKIILRSTQPAHLMMILAVFLMSTSVLQLTSNSLKSPLTNLTYLISHSIHFGNQFWMTFVSGLALFFNLPRHDFGAVQKILFPKYFTINSFLSFFTIITFTKIHHLTEMKKAEFVQVAALCTCFLVELTIRLYLVPSVIHLITVKTDLEVAAGLGREVGQFHLGALHACPHYLKLHSQFRRLHTLVAVGNIVAMACTSLHIYYMANNWLCFYSSA